MPAMPADPVEADWVAVPKDIQKSAAWRSIVKRITASDPFPGLLVEVNSNASRFKPRRLQVSAAFWTVPGKAVDEVYHFLRDVEALVDEDGNHLAQACRDLQNVVLILDITAALTKYREVYKFAPAEHYKVTHDARRIFGKLQQRIHSNGMALALSRHGYQAIRRINQFSYDKEILYGCPWLFKEQQRLHVQLQACPAEIHGNVAAVLHATLHQMLFTKGEVNQSALACLKSLTQYFASAPCQICFDTQAADSAKRLIEYHGEGGAFDGVLDTFNHVFAPSFESIPPAPSTPPQEQQPKNPTSIAIAATPQAYQVHAYAGIANTSVGSDGQAAASEPSSFIAKFDMVVLEGLKDAAEAYAKAVNEVSTSTSTDLKRVHGIGLRHILQVLHLAAQEMSSHSQAGCALPAHPEGSSQQLQPAAHAHATVIDTLEKQQLSSARDDPCLSPHSVQSLSAKRYGAVKPSAIAHNRRKHSMQHLQLPLNKQHRYNNDQLRQWRYAAAAMKPLRVQPHHQELLKVSVSAQIAEDNSWANSTGPGRSHASSISLNAWHAMHPWNASTKVW